MVIENNYILHLPHWYPTPEDEQFGVFTRKHIKSGESYYQNIVIYISGLESPAQKGKMEIRVHKDLEEYLVYYTKSGRSGILGGMSNFHRYLKAFRQAWKIVKKEHGLPVLINAHVLLKPALLALFLKIFKGLPYVITEHWTGYASGLYRSKNFYYRLLCRICLRKASGLVVVSARLKESMLEHGLLHHNTVVIPNVIDCFPKLHPPKKKEKAVILSVADLADKNKNISGSLQALKELKNLGFDFEFHIVGGGHDEAILKRLTEELGLTPCVKFHGRQSNQFVLDFMPSVDFVLVNSRVETFSVVTAEALACGKPVIVTKSGGPEVFVNNDCGLVIDTDDEESLVFALEDMVKHFNVYKPHKMQEHIHRLFNEESIGLAWKDFYDQCIKFQD